MPFDPPSPPSERVRIRVVGEVEVEDLLRAALPRYRVIERIAAGSMGVVYRAVDRRLARTVALKLLRVDRRGRRRDPPRMAVARARFMQEARAMARLAHPHVVPIYGLECAGPHVLLAMEYVPGQTLAQWLAARPRSVAEIVEVMRQAGSGLAAAHAAGFVHRDVKPHNVLIGVDGRTRVTDFGLAAMHELADTTPASGLGGGIDDGASLTGTGMTVGTPAYMAPEQHRGLVVDARCDQFAFCATLYEALFGTRPFRTFDVRMLAQAKQQRRMVAPLRPHRVPRPLVEVLLRGLSPEPRDRFASMDALVAAMVRATRPRPLRSRMPAFACGLAMLGALVSAALPERTPSAADAPSLGSIVGSPGEAGHAEILGAARRATAVHHDDVAHALLERAYFAALADARFVDAAQTADELARHDADGELWRRHARAARARALGS